MDVDPRSLRETVVGLAWSVGMLGTLGVSAFGGHSLPWEIVGGVFVTILIASTVVSVGPGVLRWCTRLLARRRR